MISLSIFTIYGLITLANAFPDGAPADTCVKQRANEPNHGASRTQALHTLPYEVRAESDSYHPGQQIKGACGYIYLEWVELNRFESFFLVTIVGHDLFRGFFIQARDAETNEWIGSWQDSSNTKPIPECASITHSDPKDKEAATFVWNAPQHKSGRVYFT